MASRPFGERLAQARRILSVSEWRDVTQSEIGELVGKTGATISRYEAGLMEVPKAVAIALESVLPFPVQAGEPAAQRPPIPKKRVTVKKAPAPGRKRA